MANGIKICSLKLFVDKKSHKVLFAEAPKEFVDFLLRLFSVPIGRVMGLMAIAGKDVMMGSGLSSVYDSVEVLCSTTCLLPNFQNDKGLIIHPKFSFGYGDGGYVKGTVTYMVLDDLTVKPTNVDIVNNLKIKDVGSIEELVVDVSSAKEVPKIIFAAMNSKTVLTDVFFNKEEEEEEEEEEEVEEEEDPIQFLGN